MMFVNEHKDLVRFFFEVLKAVCINFVHFGSALVMARTVERMGTTAFLLEEGADAQMLLENLREASFAIEQDAVEVSQKTKLSQEAILEGCMYIQRLLQTDSQLELKKVGVDKAHEEWMKATEKQKELEQAYYDREGALRYASEGSVLFT